MLDEQFFKNEKFHPFIKKNFVTIYALYGDAEGKSLFKKYNVRNYPAVLLIYPDGTEVDRFTGYFPPAGEWKKQLRTTFGIETRLLDMKRKLKETPDNVNSASQIAMEYYFQGRSWKMGAYAIKILSNIEEAKSLSIPYKDGKTVTAYEIGRFCEVLTFPEKIPDFFSEFPDTGFRDDVYVFLGKSLRHRLLTKRTLPIIKDLLKQYPEDLTLLPPYLVYCSQAGSDLDYAYDLAKQAYKRNKGHVKLAVGFAQIAIAKNDHSQWKKLLMEYNKNHPNDLNFQVIVGNYMLDYKLNTEEYLNEVYEVFKDVLKEYPDYAYGYLILGWYSVRTGKYLDKGLKAFEKLLTIDLDGAHRPKTDIYRRIGLIYEHKKEYDKAKDSYKKSLELNPENDRTAATLKALEEKLAGKK